MSEHARRTRVAAGVVVLALAVGLLGHFAVNPLVAAAVAAGRRAAVEAVAARPVPPGSTQNSRMEHAFSGELPLPDGSLAQLQQRVRVSWARAFLGLLSLAALAALWRRRAQALERLRAFFAEEDHPYTLAFLRIVVFGTLVARFDTQRWLWFVDFPPDLALPPSPC